MIKVVVDAMGGDRSPGANVEGSLQALREMKDVYVILVGDLKQINPLLEGKEYDKDRLELVDAPEVIGYDEAPTLEVFRKKDSSMMRSINILKENDDVVGMVSLGNSGAVLAGASIKIGKIPGVKRACFCPLLPTMKRGIVCGY